MNQKIAIEKPHNIAFGYIEFKLSFFKFAFKVDELNYMYSIK